MSGIYSATPIGNAAVTIEPFLRPKSARYWSRCWRKDAMYFSEMGCPAGRLIFRVGLISL